MGDLHFIVADEPWRERLGREWGPVVAAHMHLSDGFSRVALGDAKPAGLIAIVWRALGFALCPATTYPRGAPVEGYFVALVL